MRRQELLTPTGEPAGNMDSVMLLNMWAMILAAEGTPIISAGMGKPTFPVSPIIPESALSYWQPIAEKAAKAKTIYLTGLEKIRNFEANAKPPLVSEEEWKYQKHLLWQQLTDGVVAQQSAIDYGNPLGDKTARESMARALTKWYNNSVIFQSNHVLFTVGGVAALNIALKVINKATPYARIITPLPHYALYSGVDGQNRLHFINVMKNKGYKLTAESLEVAIDEANAAAVHDGGEIGAFLFCDPNNPLGTVMGKEEWQKIAEILRKHPHIPIILDEAYAEMQFSGRYISLIEVASDLLPRIILIRSATKGFSAAGERYATLVAFDPALQQKLLTEHIAMAGHAPRSAQYIYSRTMEMESVEADFIEFYGHQVNVVSERLKAIGAAMPDPAYQVEGTFYVMTDLSDLLGLPVPTGCERVLGEGRTHLKSDVDITYALLFKKGVMISPLSFYGLDPKLGYMRITCSGGDTALIDLTTRIEDYLIIAREAKYTKLLKQLDTILAKLSLNSDFEQKMQLQINNVDAIKAQREKLVMAQLDSQHNSQKSLALSLKEINDQLHTLLSQAKKLSAIEDDAAREIQRAYRHHLAATRLKTVLSEHWKQSVDKVFASGTPEEKRFLSLSPSQRLPGTFIFWKNYLQEKRDVIIEQLGRTPLPHRDDDQRDIISGPATPPKSITPVLL